MAKRRLYFTETQVLCICNASVQTERDTHGGLDRQFLGAFGHSISSDHTGHASSLSKATGLLEEYSKRELSYESDALNGISGALEFLKSSDSSLHHCYAIPFRPYYVQTGHVSAHIGLNWMHLNQSTRRAQFPSWSPLGWEGSVQFHGHQQPGVKMADKLDGLSADTKFLRVVGTCVKLSYESIYDPEQSCYVRYIILPQLHKSSRRTLAAPLWDSRSAHIGTDGSLFGMMLMQTAQVNLMVLLLTKHGSYFERVGCLPLEGRSNGETCQALVGRQQNTDYRKVYLSPTYLEDLWEKVGVTEAITLG